MDQTASRLKAFRAVTQFLSAKLSNRFKRPVKHTILILEILILIRTTMFLLLRNRVEFPYNALYIASRTWAAGGNTDNREFLF